MHWDIDPVLIRLGPLPLRWYGLFFMIGLLLAIRELPRSFHRRDLPVAHADALTLWLPIGMLIGAHLIHLLFYEPKAFLYNPKRIIEIGSGLASHGGGLGVALTLYFFTRKHRQDWHRYADGVIVAAVWVLPFVRIGNFFNSEIYGRVTDLPWGVIFDRHGFTEPRHPSQFYEAAVAFVLIALTAWLDRRYRARLRPGALVYLALGFYFSTRILLEYSKEYQVLSAHFPFTMGQLLSMPVVLLCLFQLSCNKTRKLWPLLPPHPKREAP
ncbi:MAG: prolipoprotein diacylglyceryl transferase [Polyangiales bacterium]